MSWVRWGSTCTFLHIPWTQWCHGKDEPCPGSDVHVFEDADSNERPYGFRCCGCRLTCGFGGPDFSAKTEEEMEAHLAEHHRAGHHVPLILFDKDTMARADLLWSQLSEDDRFIVLMGGDLNEVERHRGKLRRLKS